MGTPMGATAVLLLAYGGPDQLADIPDYLLDIRGGRHTPQHLVDEITERYRRIGGRSPLLSITRSAGDKLAQAVGLPVYVGMRHWHPFIQEIVGRMVDDGIQRAITICMAPHYSSMSIGAYKARLKEALAATENRISADFVSHWHTQPDYLDGIASNARKTLTRFPKAVRGQVHVIFTAHSLPVAILERGDPYDTQLRETAHLLSRRLALPDGRWSFSYQSAAQTGVPWLGPQIEEHIVELAQAGEQDLLIAPIGFIADHVEILYDIDIKVQEIAQAHRVHMERTPMLNDSPALVAALTSLVQERLAHESTEIQSGTVEHKESV